MLKFLLRDGGSSGLQFKRSYCRSGVPVLADNLEHRGEITSYSYENVSSQSLPRLGPGLPLGPRTDSREEIPNLDLYQSNDQN